jgi:hypothetical protein
MKKQENAAHGGAFVDIYHPYQKDTFYFSGRSDPRTDRFSTSMNFQNYSGWMGLPNVTMWAGSNGPEVYGRYAPTTFVYQGTGGQGSPPINNYNVPGMLSENRSSPSTSGYNVYYTDVDGTLRRAEGAYATKSSKDGLPLFTGNAASRPVVLCRPFRSVGEIGYAFRDMPWKNIDFFTPESADAGLLDVFTVNDVDMIAGHVSLNTRQAPVLQALLSGALLTETATNQISSSVAQGIAQQIVTTSSTSPLMNRGELVTRFSSPADTQDTSLPSLALGSTSDNTIKTHRESITRALAEVANARTWNLMIDVIAQTGTYPPNTPNTSHSLGASFVVQGERRYWLHVAIDRYTGQIVDSILEPVYE